MEQRLQRGLMLYEKSARKTGGDDETEGAVQQCKILADRIFFL